MLPVMNEMGYTFTCIRSLQPNKHIGMGFGNIQKIIGKGGGKNTVVVMFKKDIAFSASILLQIKVTDLYPIWMYAVAHDCIRAG